LEKATVDEGVRLAIIIPLLTVAAGEFIHIGGITGDSVQWTSGFLPLLWPRRIKLRSEDPGFPAV
jgi:hypothetical protein